MSCKTILKNFEFEDLFISSNENLQDADFVNNAELTSCLDKILREHSYVEWWMIVVMKRHAIALSSSDKQKWLADRLNILRTNKYLNAYAPNRELRVYEKRKQAPYANTWQTKSVRNAAELESWIRKEIHAIRDFWRIR